MRKLINSAKFNKKYFYKTLFWSINLSIFLYLFTKKYKIISDSKSYIDNYISRTPIYPLILDFFQIVFGESYLAYVYFFQILFCFVSVYVLIKTFKNNFIFSDLLYYFLFWIFLYFPIILNIPNNILTESVTYCFFLLTISFVVRTLFYSNIKNIIPAILLSVFTTLIRPQFMFLVIFCLLLTFFIFLSTREYKKLIFCLIIAILSLSGAKFFQKGYNYILHGTSSTIHSTGIQLLITQLFIDDHHDIIFNNQEEKIFLDKTEEIMKEQGIAKHRNNIGYFIFHYNEIGGILKRTYFVDYEKKQFSNKEWIEFDRFTMRIALSLIKNNFKTYIIFIIKNVFYYFGVFYMILVLFGTGISLYLYNKSKDIIALFFILMTTLNLLNYFLVSSLEPAYNRYTFYTDTTQLVAFILLIMSLLKQKIAKKEERI